MGKLGEIRFSLRRAMWGHVFLDRIVATEKTRELLSRLSLSNFSVLEISGDSYSDLPVKSFKSVYFPDFDVCQSPLNETFDLIIANQVFEHLLWPYRAGKNVFTMLNEGGYFLVITPFLLKIHNAPVDCTRWSETGIRYFLAECGFDLEQTITGSWGNRKAAKANMVVNAFPLYNPILHRDFKTDPMFPVQVWALAKRQCTKPA